MAKQKIPFIDKSTGKPLTRSGDCLIADSQLKHSVIGDIPRFVSSQSYTENFGYQWNKFDRTQIDDDMQAQSHQRLFGESGWAPGSLAGKTVLEAGSGAGRFSRIILRETEAELYSFDYSNAVEANWNTNKTVAPGRFVLFQASIYEIPFAESSFDKVLCLGVLQHTPDFEASVRALIKQAKAGGEIVVDFYSIKGFWTKISSKYALRPFTKKLSNKRLLSFIKKNISWMIKLSDLLARYRLGFLTRFIPLVDLRTLPKNLDSTTRREWAILDTFDMFSPEYDQPQKISSVVAMFERNGANVTFAGRINGAAVVRGIKQVEND